MEFSSERFRNTFEAYVVQSSGKQGVEQKKHAYERELLLSQLFTPCQKVLLRKKTEGQPFTKTEKEYFFRVVKKRLRALADDELHEWASRLLRQ